MSYKRSIWIGMCLVFVVLFITVLTFYLNNDGEYKKQKKNLNKKWQAHPRRETKRFFRVGLSIHQWLRPAFRRPFIARNEQTETLSKQKEVVRLHGCVSTVRPADVTHSRLMIASVKKLIFFILSVCRRPRTLFHFFTFPLFHFFTFDCCVCIW